jgi:undecaprenyl-diphosphatase
VTRAGDALARFDAFDARADERLEVMRGRPTDVVFRVASTVGDFSLVWHVIGVTTFGLVQGDWRRWLGFAALIGAESLIVNQGIKPRFRRERPTETGDPRFTVRRPRTSSFPSGHASSAAFAATLLTASTGWALAPVWIAIAIVVALSRVVVRIHHASDIIAGAITGTTLAVLALALTGWVG